MLVIDDLPELAMLTAARRLQIKLSFEEAERVADFIRAMDESIPFERRLDWALAAEGYAIEKKRADGLKKAYLKLVASRRATKRPARETMCLASLAFSWLEFKPESQSYDAGIECARIFFREAHVPAHDQNNVQQLKESVLRAVSDAVVAEQATLASPDEALRMVAESQLD